LWCTDHGGEDGRYHPLDAAMPYTSEERNPTVLTMTDSAALEIRNLIAHPEIPDDAGVRIASTADGALTLSLAGGPNDGDAVVESEGARVFVEPEASELLDDKELDAGTDPEGNVQFSIGLQA
jgi:iron-sulfur cluster assembly protein